MHVVYLVKSLSYQAIYPQTPYLSPDSLILTNNSQAQLFVIQADEQPDNDAPAFCVNPEQTVLVHGNNQPIWVRGGNGPILVQLLSRTVTPFTAIEFPHDVMTSDREGFRRLRVDVGQTAFFVGREARTFKELSIAQGQRYVAQITLPVDVVLFESNLSIDNGSIKLSTIANATAVDSFFDVWPIIPKNTMSSRQVPYYTPQTEIVGGGSITGGTVIDVARVVSPSSTSKHTTVGGTISGERGVGAGTYYWVFENIGNGTVTGVFSCFWEERPTVEAEEDVNVVGPNDTIVIL
jgi:hypothetical protein